MPINNANDSVGGSVSTTDATPTTATTYAVPDNSSIAVRARVVARNSTNGDVAVWDLKCAAKRTGGGNTSIVGAVKRDLHTTDAAHEWWFADLKASGTNLIIQVKGEAGVNLDWSAQFDTRTMYIT